MGRKRRKAASRQGDEQGENQMKREKEGGEREQEQEHEQDYEHENNQEQVHEHEHEKSLLKQLGLPTHFGGGKSSSASSTNTVEKFDASIEAYPPIDILPDAEHSEGEEEAPKAKRKKKGKKGPILSEHSVIRQEYTVKELLAYFPDGFVCHRLNNEDTTNDTTITATIADSSAAPPATERRALHIRYDEEGDPIVPEAPSSAVVQPASVQPISTSVEDANIKKYHRQRYDLFHHYDEGIQIDGEGWFSVTPESIARHLSASLFGRLGAGVVWDAFAGVGGNAIQYAQSGFHVIATELDRGRIAMAQNNARVYGVADYIDFVLADALQLPRFWRVPKDGSSSRLDSNNRFDSSNRFDSVFLSPPWGGPSYLKAPVYDPVSMLPINCTAMVRAAHECAGHVTYYMPKTTDIRKLAALVPSDGKLIVEQHYLAERLKVVVVSATCSSRAR